MDNREHWARILQQHEIRPSYTRLSVFSYLAQSKAHPSADEIYSDLSNVMPTLSKMTVYNTLRILVDKGLARLISIEEHEARYDADVSLHGHFKCTHCGRVSDFHVRDAILDDILLSDHEVFEKDVFFRGICPQCRTRSISKHADRQGLSLASGMK